MKKDTNPEPVKLSGQMERERTSTTHYAHEWGMTLCGLDGWRPHLWSGWDHPDSLKSTIEWRKVTCLNCRKRNRLRKP